MHSEKYFFAFCCFVSTNMIYNFIRINFEFLGFSSWGNISNVLNLWIIAMFGVAVVVSIDILYFKILVCCT